MRTAEEMLELIQVLSQTVSSSFHYSVEVEGHEIKYFYDNNVDALGGVKKLLEDESFKELILSISNGSIVKRYYRIKPDCYLCERIK